MTGLSGLPLSKKRDKMTKELIFIAGPKGFLVNTALPYNKVKVIARFVEMRRKDAMSSLREFFYEVTLSEVADNSQFRIDCCAFKPGCTGRHTNKGMNYTESDAIQTFTAICNERLIKNWVFVSLVSTPGLVCEYGRIYHSSVREVMNSIPTQLKSIEVPIEETTKEDKIEEDSRFTDLYE